jgi:pilus assembly protein CpaF
LCADIPGVPGLGSVHASSAREAVTKLCTLALLAGPNVTTSFVVPTVAASVDLVVFCAMDPNGRRSVREVAAVPGRVEGEVVEISSLFSLVDGELNTGGRRGTRGSPERADRGP